MNRKSLLELVNEKLDRPLIFFCREPERAIGLEKLLKNYHIACVEDSPLVDELLHQNISVFCIERHLKEKSLPSLTQRSTSELINHELTKEWIASLSSQSFYALVFKPVKSLEYKVIQMGGTLLQSALDSGAQFENKVFQIELFNRLQIQIPRTQVHELGKESFRDLIKIYGDTFIIQLEKGHTGTGTFFIHDEVIFNSIIKEYKGNTVRIAEYIKGEPLTINACIGSNIYIGSPQYQITGIKKLHGQEGTTMGNDFVYGAQLVTDQVKIQLQTILTKLGTEMKSKGYEGLFGIDVIIKDNQVYVIEINARQTANIPFETKLTLKESLDAIPLQLLHIAHFLKILPNDYQHTNFMNLHGAQIFLRSPEDGIELIDECKNGIYRLQSDNAAYDFENDEVREGVIFIDEIKDKPMVWQYNGYAVDEVKEGGFVLLTGRTGSKKNRADEIARMQFLHQIVNAGVLAPWTIEALQTVEGLITRLPGNATISED